VLYFNRYVVKLVNQLLGIESVPINLHLRSILTVFKTLETGKVSTIGSIMKDIHNRKLTFLGLLFFVLFGVFATVGSEIEKIFDGKKKIIMYFHDSIGPANFKERIKRFLEESGKDPNSIFFVDGMQPGTHTIYQDDEFVWGSRCTFVYAKRIEDIEEQISTARTLAGCPDCPVLVFIQAGGGKFFISDTTDQQRIDLSCREFESAAQMLKDRGASNVFYATTSYHWEHGKLRENEFAMINEYKRRNEGKSIFVDMATPTYAEYPLPQAGDFYHPNKYGYDLTGHLWFKALCDFDGIDVPQWSLEMVREKRDAEIEFLNKLTYEGPFKGRFKKGDVIRVSFDNKTMLSPLTVKMYAHRLDARQRQDNCFEMGSRYDAGSVSVPEGATFVDFPITDDVINTLQEVVDAPHSRYLEQPDPSYAPAIPVMLALTHGTHHMDHWWGSTLDLNNPENMVLIHLGNDTDPSTPIYPDGCFPPENRAAPKMESLLFNPQSSAHTMGKGPQASAPVIGLSSNSFVLPAAGHVQLSVHDQLGRRIAVLYEGSAGAGKTTFSFGKVGASGIRILRLETQGVTIARCVSQ